MLSLLCSNWRSLGVSLGWFAYLSIAGGMPGCRAGYELLDDGGVSNLGGVAGDGDGDAIGGVGGAGGTSSTGGSNTGGAEGLSGMVGSGASSAACDPNAFFCSDFQAPLSDDWDGFDVQNASCIVELSSAPVLTESTSLRSFTPVGCRVARLNYDFDALVTTGPLSIRGWFYLPSSVVLDDEIVVLELHDATVGSAGKASINLGPSETVTLEVTTGISPGGSTSAGGIFARDTWNCAVLRASVSNTAGALEVEINGVTIHSITGGDVLPEPGFSRAIAGTFKYGRTDVEVFLDDVSIAQAELSCP